MSAPNPNVGRFMKLFSGLETAYGTARGGWVKEPPRRKEYSGHLAGLNPGLGIAPLRQDGTVVFAAIDLDEPDFETAKTMATLLPGTQFIERSRSGNAHVFAFFAEPVEAWIARGIMREATAAVGKRFVEVFPKQDRLRIGMVGNYINLPYHGEERPVVGRSDGGVAIVNLEAPFTLERFLDEAEASLNDPKDWIKRAGWLGIPSPNERSQESRDFGTQSYLHMCCEHVIENRDTTPIVAGHRAVVYFSLCKMLANCNQFDQDEALAILGLINDSSPDPITEGELRHMYQNAVNGEYTSTGCDDPLFAPYAHPDCPIANGKVGR